MGRVRRSGPTRQNAGVALPAPRGRLRNVAIAAGIVGPGFFISDWAVLGARAAGYSPVHDAISELARMHAATRPAMTAGFVVLGAAVPAYALALRDALPGPAWRFAVVHGVATLGVAAFALGTPTSGKIHGAFAGLAYASLAAVPIAAGVPLSRRGRRGSGQGVDGHRSPLRGGARRQRGRTSECARVAPAHRPDDRRRVADHFRGLAPDSTRHSTRHSAGLSA